MKRGRSFISLTASVIFSLLLVPAGSVALGPDSVKGGASSPLGGGSGKPAPAQAPPAAPVQGVAPKGTIPPQVAAPPAPGTPAALPAEPKWPHNFELGEGERTGFGFVAGQPGPIVVTVKWQGAPLVVTLGKPGGATVERQGNGVVTIEYAATADDVKKGVLWGIGLRAAQEKAKPATGQVGNKPLKRQYQVLAKGTVAVQHPPGDAGRAQAELNAHAEKIRAEQSKPMPAAPPQADALAQAKAGLQKQQAARQTQLLEQIRPKIPADVFQKMSGKISAGANPVGDAAQKASSGATGGGVASQSSPATAAPAPLAMSKGPRIAVETTGTTLGPVVPGVSSTQSGQVGVAGSTQPASVAAPVIASLSVAQGVPGDPVNISGSGFADTPGEVHFIVANGRDLVAPITYWSGSQIVTEVPYTDGVPSYPGSVYVKRADGAKTGLLSFRFNPPLDIAIMGISNSDNRLPNPQALYQPWWTQDWNVNHPSGVCFGGIKGDDQFYIQTQLKNGWFVENVELVGIVPSNGLAMATIGPHINGEADAYIVESRVGTASLYAKVHFWANANPCFGGGVTGLVYAVRYTIRGPKGLAYK